MEPTWSATQTIDIVPVTSHQSEFLRWVRAAVSPSEPRTQHPIDELLGEHHVIGGVVAALERQARRLFKSRQLDPQIWDGFVDLLGNWVNQVHRRKEEQGLFTMLQESIDAKELERHELPKVISQYAHCENDVVDLFNGVGEGDWEKVARAAVNYVQFSRARVTLTEQRIFPMARNLLEEANVANLRNRFNELESFGLGDRKRMYYMELARSLCEGADLKDVLTS